MARTRPKRVVHEWWTARYESMGAGVARLTPRRGCVRKIVELGESIVESMTREPHRVLVANIGDQLLLFGRQIDEIQSVIVEHVRIAPRSTETLYVRRCCGDDITSEIVHVLRGRRAA